MRDHRIQILGSASETGALPPLCEAVEPIFTAAPSCCRVNAPITIPIGLWWIGVSKRVRQGLIKVDKTFA
jgi:hypothetical protein